LVEPGDPTPQASASSDSAHALEQPLEGWDDEDDDDTEDDDKDDIDTESP
jgi:hypothetical protein